MEGKKYLNQENPIYTEEFEGVIGQPPRNLLKWGLISFLGLFLFFFALLYFIKYPTVVTRSLILRAVNAPKSVVSHNAGKIIKLLTKDGELVQAGDILAYLESTTDHEAVLNLSSGIDSVSKLVQSDGWDKVFVNAIEFKKFGELQNSFQGFYSSFNKLKEFLINGDYRRKRELFYKNLENFSVLNNNLSEQKILYQRDLELARKEFESQKYLYESKVISLSEFRKEESRFLTKELPMASINNGIMDNHNSSLSIKRSLLELDDQLQQIKYDFVESLNTLRNDLETWKKKFLLIAPISGVVSFSQFIQENQDISINTPIIFITPPMMDILAKCSYHKSILAKFIKNKRLL